MIEVKYPSFIGHRLVSSYMRTNPVCCTSHLDAEKLNCHAPQRHSVCTFYIPGVTQQRLVFIDISLTLNVSPHPYAKLTPNP